MGNQPGSPNSSRFTLRNLSWRPSGALRQQRQPSNEYADDDDSEWDNQPDYRPGDTRSIRTVNFNPFNRFSSKSKRMPSQRQESTNFEEQPVFFDDQQDDRSQRQSEMYVNDIRSVRESVGSSWSTPTRQSERQEQQRPMSMFSQEEEEEMGEPAFHELYDKLVAFYEKHDAEALENREIDIEGMVRWTLEDEDGSLEILNGKLLDRYGSNLEDMESPEDRPRSVASRMMSMKSTKSRKSVQSFASSQSRTKSMASNASRMTSNTMGGATTATRATGKPSTFAEMSIPAPDRYSVSSWGSEEEEEKDRDSWGADAAPPPPPGAPEDDELSNQVREQLERFFLAYDPEGLNDGVEEMMDEFHANGRMAMNVALYRQYGKNLTTLLADEGSRRDDPQPEPMGRTMQSTRKASKFGVHVAPDSVLNEMSTKSRDLRHTNTDFKTNKRMDSVRKQSNVGASLQRKWDHLANKNRGVSSRISTHVSKRLPAKSAASSSSSSSKQAVTPFQMSSTPFKKPSNNRPMSTVYVGECPKFQIDLEGTFGVCKNCGKKRGDHYKPKASGISQTLQRRWDRLGTKAL